MGRGHPDGIESRSNTQTSEQKESGYFSNPRSTNSKNLGMALPATRAMTTTERKLTALPKMNRRQTYQQITTQVSDGQESNNEFGGQSDKTMFLHLPIFEGHRKRATVVMDIHEQSPVQTPESDSMETKETML